MLILKPLHIIFCNNNKALLTPLCKLKGNKTGLEPKTSFMGCRAFGFYHFGTFILALGHSSVL